MLGRAVQLVVVAVVWADVAGVTPPAEVTPFCRDGPLGASCVFVNTTQDVEVGGGPVMAAGVASRHPVKIPCLATLDVTNSSINITVRKAAAAATPDPPRASQPSLNTTERDVTAPQAAPSGASHVPQPLLNTTETKTETNVKTPLTTASDPSHASHPSLNTTETTVTDLQGAPSRPSYVPQPLLNTTKTIVTDPQGAPSGPSHVPQPFLNTTKTNVAASLTAASDPSLVPHPLLNTTETNMTAPLTAASDPSLVPQPLLNTTETNMAALLTAASDPSHASQPPLSSVKRGVTAPHSAVVATDSPKLRNVSGALLLPPPPRECVVNISVKHSTLHEVRGRFDAAQFNNSKIVHLGGVYVGEVSVKDSEVANISLSSKTMAIQDTKIELISDLRVQLGLAMLHVEVGRVAAGGLLLHSSGMEEPRQTHLLRHVTVGRMEAESLVVAGARVYITDVTVDALVKDAVIVRTGGKLTLTRVVLHHCDLFHCLNLERGARLVLRNTTIRNRKITKMDLQAPSDANLYPLSSLASKDAHPSLQVTFPWYWVVIMAVCGVVAGLVIGSALRWRRRTLRVSPDSTLTLADLLSHDRLQEGNIRDHLTDNATSPLRRPTLARQDSGLTSSSFASYVPFQAQASTVVTPTVTMSSEEV